MKIKQTSDRSFFRTPVMIGLMLIGLAVILSVLSLTLSFSKAKNSALALKSLQSNDRIMPARYSPKMLALWKEKLWLENQLRVSKEDSMNLSINLRDRSVELRFKGLTLVKSKISLILPRHFLQPIDAGTYGKLFGSPATIISERANTAKKPYHRVSATQAGDTTAFLKKVKPGMFSWHFITNHNIRVVIHGYDSLETNLHPQKDLLKYRLKNLITKPGETYMPTIFIWINNKEAIDIYRALPQKSKVIFLN